jgi:hypothetical protein
MEETFRMYDIRITKIGPVGTAAAVATPPTFVSIEVQTLAGRKALEMSRDIAWELAEALVEHLQGPGASDRRS